MNLVNILLLPQLGSVRFLSTQVTNTGYTISYCRKLILPMYLSLSEQYLIITNKTRALNGSEDTGGSGVWAPRVYMR